MRFIRILLTLFVFINLMGCSISANISVTDKTPVLADESHQLPSNNYPSFFLNGEQVTTSTGHTMKATFSEIPEKSTSANGYTMEAVFVDL